MFIWILYFVLIFTLLGRYNVAGYKLLPEKYAYPFVSLVIIFFTIFRFNMGFDWSTYFFSIWPRIDYRAINQYEPITRLFYAISIFFSAPILIFVFHGCITLSLIFFSFSKYSKSRYESLIVFLCMFYPESLSTIRQWLAISILFFGFENVRKQKLDIYFLYTLIAMMCHKSAIYGAILIYCIYNFPYKRFLFIIDFILIIFGKRLLDFFSSINFHYVHYLRSTFVYTGGDRIKYAFLLFWICLFLLNKSKFKKNIDYNLFGLVLTGIVFPFIFGGHLGGRIGIYCYFYFCLLIPNVLSMIKNIYKRSSMLLVLYLYFIILIYTNIHSPDPTYKNYKFYFFTNKENELIN